MSNELLTEDDGFGRIEVVPDILLTIAERTTIANPAIIQLADPPSAESRRHSRRLRKHGILLTMDENRVIFDIYAIMDGNVNLMEASRKLQTALIDSVAEMIGVTVNAVNVHIEDVAYPEV